MYRKENYIMVLFKNQYPDPHKRFWNGLGRPLPEQEAILYQKNLFE